MKCKQKAEQDKFAAMKSKCLKGFLIYPSLNPFDRFLVSLSSIAFLSNARSGFLRDDHFLIIIGIGYVNKEIIAT